MRDHITESQRHEALKAFIIKKIQQSNGIPFSEYMRDALYTPELGYYKEHPHIFGCTEQKDCTPDPEIS